MFSLFELVNGPPPVQAINLVRANFLTPYPDLGDGNNPLDIQLPPLPVGDTVPGPFPFFDTQHRDADVASLVHIWLNPIIGTGENAYIMRNDALLHLMHIFSGLTSFTRDTSKMSTVNRTRSDRTDLFNGIPLVHTEEKEYDTIETAIQELQNKFQ